MMRIRRPSFLLTVVSALLVAGCEKPGTVEQFIKAQDSADGVYNFELPLDDSLGTYDFSFYTRIDRPFGAEGTGCLRLDVLWRSPSGKTAGETVYMNVAELRDKYRSGVSPKEYGKWSMEVKVPDPPAGLLGLGIICEHDGTR